MNKNYKKFSLAVPTEQDMINAMNVLKALGFEQSSNTYELEFSPSRMIRHGCPYSQDHFWMSRLGKVEGNHYTNLGDLVVYLTTPEKTERQKRIASLKAQIATLISELTVHEEDERTKS